MIKKLVLGMAAGVVALVLAQAINVKQVDGSTATKSISSPTLTTTEASTTIKANVKTVTQLNVDADRAVFIVGPIYDMTAVVSQIYALDKASSAKRITIVLSSPGGSILEGAKVINAIEGVKAPVDTVCTEMCASEAAIIHSYGAVRYMTDRTFLMYHDYSGGFQGEGAHMHSLMTAIERFVKRSNAHIAERSGVKLETLEIGELKQIWVDSEDATASNYNDKIVSLDVSSLLPKDPAANAKLKEQFKHATDSYDNLRRVL